MDWLDKIISLYLFVRSEFRNELSVYCQRFNNYADLSCSDEEVATIYMFVVMEGLKDKKKIYNQAKNYWHFLFPRLPSYTAVIQKINKLGNAFIGLTDNLQKMLPPEVFAMEHKRLINSMPIILAHNDVEAYQAIMPEILEYEKFADKAYVGLAGTKTYTPIKRLKDQEFLEAADQLYSTAVSKIRQPIESLFNWLEDKVSIQIASKVRSYNGLMVHILGKLAVALNLLVAKFSS